MISGCKAYNFICPNDKEYPKTSLSKYRSSKRHINGEEEEEEEGNRLRIVTYFHYKII